MRTPTFTLRLSTLGLFGLLAFSALPASAADSTPSDFTPIPYQGMTPADTATLNAAAVKQLVAIEPDAKAVFDAHPEFKLFKGNSAISPAPFNPATHDNFVQLAKSIKSVVANGNIDLLFAGDSITDWWRLAGPQGGKDVFAKYFGDLKVLNFAIAGDTTQGVLYRLQNGEGQGFQPKAVMLMIGTNNTGSNTAGEIVDGVIADLNELRKDFPNAKILLLGIFPRSTPGDPVRKTIADINAKISQLDDGKHIFYMDIGAKFLGPDGTFLPGIFRSDNLHPQAPGYEIWAQAVKNKLADLMK